MQFKFKLPDIRLFVDVVDDQVLVNKFVEYEKSGPYFAKGKYPTDRYLVDLSKGEIELVIDALSNHLMTSGLNDDGEPNALGFQIETLIDVLNKN
ncbi:MAG: hypothetical protein ABJN40_00035 [Sneathiella sp.]